MGRKGQKDCCCDNCHIKFVGERIDPIAQLCCSCMPKEVCIGFQVYETGFSSQTVFNHECATAYSPPNQVYAGWIGYGDSLIDLQFFFRIVGLQCYFCVSSTALGISQSGSNSCVLVDANARTPPNDVCGNFLLNGYPVNWTLNTPLGTTTISIGPALNTPITGRQPCLDPYGSLVNDDDPIRNVCTGCGCICTCASLIVQYKGTFVGEACRNGVNWIAGDSYHPYVVQLQANPTSGSCQLALVQTGPISVNNLPAPIPIGSVETGHPCPTPVVKFEGFDKAGIAYFITFACDPCLNGAPLPPGRCCPEGLPRVLTATISSPDGTCSCGAGTIGLVYDDMFSAWIGFVSKGFCGNDVKLTFTCGGDGGYWSLVFESPPCVVTSSSGGYSVCNPISAQFNFGLGGIQCCNQISGTHNIVVKVTE
jgi:hypothetical protein